MAATPSSRPAARPRGRKPSLSEATIVEAALRVLRKEGLDAVSMRRVAKELGTGAASLYAYVQNRDDLYDLVYEEVTGLVPRPEAVDPSRWREQMRQLLLDTRDTFGSYPGLARVALARIPTGPNAMEMIELMLALFLAGGVEPQRAAWACDNLFLIVTADAVEGDIERELAQQGEDLAGYHEGIHQQMRALPADRFPNVAKHAEALTSGDGRQRFEFAIDTYLAGVLR